MGDSLSASDVMALAKDNDGFLEGNGIIILILFFLLFGFNGGGSWGSNNLTNQATQQDIVNGFNFNNIDNGIRGVQQGLCQIGYENLQNANSIQAAIAQQGFNQQQCCCGVERNIDSVRAENYRNTCEITNAIHQEGEQTRGLITANVMQELRDQVQTYQNQLSNLSQTNTLISQLSPTPKPAYVTCSPYQAQTLAMGLYGNVGSCGC